MANPPNLNDALHLYELIGKYVPLYKKGEKDSLKFIRTIVDNIQENKDYDAYLKTIELMTGTTFNVLQSSSSDEILDLFIRGLVEWRIIELVEFFREVGYQNA